MRAYLYVPTTYEETRTMKPFIYRIIDGKIRLTYFVVTENKGNMWNTAICDCVPRILIVTQGHL